ncbi:hypothetical protein C8250_020880 [Streptomyces sp. So13.3]|uniref:hypothetical protein n=1 Tax=Streptomyces TaxID=1883 RepID=UPI0011069AED|nr:MULTISPECIES: hypothetical protein [Streptomyces]MCZ4102887.1 hypothetical protein [Streptomyces sp. H39-C1]QNA74044.1 hypothetical protein C8250_020880 [Streptomyces sp. So13.3]
MPFDPFAPSDPFEDDLGQAIRGTAGTFFTDNRALVDGGAARGRVMRLRRRAAVAGGAATLTLVAVGGLMAGGMSGSAGHHVAEDPAAQGGPRSVAVASGERVTAQHMINLLKSALPPGVTTGEQGRGTGAEGTGDPIGAPYAEVVYDDGHGPGLVSVSLNHAPSGQGVGPGAGTRCPDRVYVPFDSCDRSVLADGSVLVLLKGYEYPDHRVNTKNWRATLTTRDGQVVDAMEWNSPAEKGAPDTRPDPPLTAAQLTAVVNMTIWKPVFDALGPSRAPAGQATRSPADPPTLAEASSSVPGPAISAVLKGLIPAGMKRSDADDSEGFAHVTVDDGHGRTLIEVNVEHWPVKDPDTLAFFSGGEKLADGTRVLVSQGSAEKGGAGTVRWVAQILRPNGRRIVVAELNAGGYHQPATRTAPVFTIDRLKSMALSPDWKKLD